MLSCCGIDETALTENSRLEQSVKGFVSLTMIFGLAAILAGVIIGVQSYDHVST